MPTRHNNSGSALLTVLWLCAALSAIGLAVANNVRGETERASTNVDDTKSYFVARGGIERAAMRMFWGPEFYQFGNPTMNFDFPGAQVRVDIIPETSKLGINTIREEDLIHLLLTLGMPEERAAETTAAVLDWRTPVDPLKGSPFDAFYLAQTPSFQAAHASFTENEELLLVRGITPELYYGTSLDGSRAGLRDCVSVYGSPFSVDVNTARLETLETVGLLPELAAEIVKVRERHVLGPEELGQIQLSAGPAASRLRMGGQLLYTFRATARLRDGNGKLSDLRRTVAALVRIYFPGNRQGRTPGFEVLRWYDRT